MTGAGDASALGHGPIDVHAHFLPEGYRAALREAGHDQPDGFPFIPEWSAAEHVAMMDRQGIATSMLSISSPGVHLDGGLLTADLTREVNEAGRRAVVDQPGRFGLFASLPLPDVDATLAEIAHCTDHLEADGFAVLTNVGGIYLGAPEWEPVFAELDRRRSRLFIHPTSPPCWEHTSLGRPRPMVEFLFDTTRAVVDLVLNGVVARYPGVEIIVPHAGAMLPMIADRVAAFTRLLAVGSEVDVLRDLGRLHFDLAGHPIPRQLDAVVTLTTLDHLHYGSDYPFTPEFAVEMARDRLLSAGDGTLHERLRANTLRLFPRLAAG
ncbi:MAG: amidohydrolase [Ilumatobacteraceae bacterium]|nr:amidohydrolase [Ilumatobacter sp.]MCO5328507.1 amidohydrolase [Ilumatobacteraceae bacterium]